MNAPTNPPPTWREAHPALDDIMARMRLEAIGLDAPELALALLHLDDCAGFPVGSDEDGTVALAALRGMQALGSVVAAEASAARVLHRVDTAGRPPLAVDVAARPPRHLALLLVELAAFRHDTATRRHRIGFTNHAADVRECRAPLAA